MRKLFTLLLLAAITLSYTNCKKSDNTTHSSPFADSLRASCATPFTGHGDSSEVSAPTAFSPNGDGINDVYYLIGRSVSSTGFSSFHISIYDTTGKIVYQSVDNTFRWDGMDQSTHKLSTQYKFYVTMNYTTPGGITDTAGTYLYLLQGTTCVHGVAADTAKYRFPDQFDFLEGTYSPTWPAYETYCL